MTEERLVGLYAKVPESLRRAVRVHAAELDLSMSQTITRALLAYFSQPKGAAPRMKK